VVHFGELKQLTDATAVPLGFRWADISPFALGRYEAQSYPSHRLMGLNESSPDVFQAQFAVSTFDDDMQKVMPSVYA
jgi:hypothetical protein